MIGCPLLERVAPGQARDRTRDGSFSSAKRGRPSMSVIKVENGVISYPFKRLATPSAIRAASLCFCFVLALLLF